ncbi:MAG TPA: MMPL family transporter [Xanthobacteraceae bacterium]|nr:MMPL family transporter [Xanthobacteraceae bacterium]
MKTTTAFVVRAIAFCWRYAWPVIAGALLLAVLSSWYAATHFSMTTNINQLISNHIPWREREAALEKAFPHFQTVVAVIDAPTPEFAEEATGALKQRLSQQPKMFLSIQEPGGGPFFAQNGLLFLKSDELAARMGALTQATRLIQVLAGDPSLRGALQALQFGLLGVQSGRITLDAMSWPLTLAANAIEEVNAGKPASFSWRELVTGKPAKTDELRRFLQVRVALDYSSLEPGQKASDAIRQAAKDLDFAGKYQARLRLTGPVPLTDEEFSTITENAGVNATVTIAVVLFILWMALRWWRIIFAVFVTLVVGLSITAALGLLMVGTLNLISVYFAVLFVGLGVDFGIQFSVRYRAERHEVDDLHTALLQAGRRAGAPLTLAALATAAGFLSFLPTAYRGVSELGLIAGVGMLIAFATSVTLLPALLSRLNPPSEPEPLGYAVLAPVDRFLERNRVPILIATAAAVVAGLPLLYWLQFDFNPMNLRSSKVESVATYLELKNDPNSGANDIQVLQPNLAAADQLAGKLRALPEVARAVTLSTFIPDAQQQKLAIIDNAAKTLNGALNPPALAAPPTDAQNVSMINSTVEALNRLAGDAKGPGADAARRLAAAMTVLGKADQAARQRADVTIAQPLRTALDQLRDLFKAKQISRETIPADVTQQWVTPDGQARIEVAPKGDANNNAVLERFADAVQAVAPDATEGPISILDARRTVVIAFIEAGACALASIAVLLWFTLRRIGDVLLTLVPLLLACVVTLEICVIVGLPLNFANIIALPLLLGVGVAFKIYYIMAWREGQTNLLQSVLTRAVIFSALTTATAFGSLWFSSHPGTSSMGKLLAISLLTTMAAAALFQPVLMGKPREQEKGF